MPTIYQHETARRDLIQHYVYLAENASSKVAERFLVNAEASFNELAKQPFIGAPLRLQNPTLAGLRKWRVNGFDKHLIFYSPHDGSISIIRVLHSANDWWRILETASRTSN